MVTMVTDMAVNHQIKIALLGLTFFGSSQVFAGDLQIQPRASANMVVSDNVELTESDEDLSLVALLSPGIHVQYLASGAELDLDYAITQSFYSHDFDLNDTYNDLILESSLDLWDTDFKLLTNASITNISRDNAENAQSDLVSGDTVQYFNSSMGLLYNTKSSAFSIDSKVMFTYSDSEDSIGEREGFNASFNSENGNSARLVFWDVNARYSEYDNNSRTGSYYTTEGIAGWITNYKINPFIRYYDEGTSGNLNDSKIRGTQSIGAGVRWQVSNHTQLDVAYNFVDKGSEPDGGVTEEAEDYVSASLEWQPSKRTQLHASYYKRFFGDAYKLSYNHRTKRLTTRVSYNEEISVFDRQDSLQGREREIWCLKDAPIGPGTCIISPGPDFDLTDYFLVATIGDDDLQQSQSFTLVKTLSLTTQLALKRTTYGFQISKTKREDLNFRDNDDYDRASFNIDRFINRTLVGSVGFSFSNNTFDNNDTLGYVQNDYYRIYLANLQKSIGHSIIVTSTFQHLNRSSNREGFTYSENRLSIQLVKEF